jgi:hypothetical protein
MSEMHDCHDDLVAYHDDEVTLPQKERSAMRERRNANRDRLKKGLKEAGKTRGQRIRESGFVRHEEHDAAPRQ